jgi:hypothetical protein
MLNSCGLVCFASWLTKQATDSNEARRSGGIEPNHRAASATRGARPMGPIGERASLFEECQSGGGTVVLRGRISGTMVGAVRVFPTC